MTLSVRPAREDDVQILYDWANDPEARRVSFSSDPILWATHVAWFEARLGDPKTALFIVMQGEAPVGQIRFDDAGDRQAIISISIDPNQRGRGLGAEALRTGIRAIAHRYERITAQIKPDNARSIAVFEKAGFAFAPQSQQGGSEVVEMTISTTGGDVPSP